MTLANPKRSRWNHPDDSAAAPYFETVDAVSDELAQSAIQRWFAHAEQRTGLALVGLSAQELSARSAWEFVELVSFLPVASLELLGVRVPTLSVMWLVPDEQRPITDVAEVLLLWADLPAGTVWASNEAYDGVLVYRNAFAPWLSRSQLQAGLQQYAEDGTSPPLLAFAKEWLVFLSQGIVSEQFPAA